MAKQRHEESGSGSSLNPLVILTAGVVLVGGLVAWALTRTVEVSSAPPPAEQTQIADTQMQPLTETAARNTPPLAPLTTTSGTPPPRPPEVQGDRHEVHRMAAEDLNAKWSRGDVTVIDVRDEKAYEAGHIPGALHMQFATIEGQIDLIPKGKQIVLYCT